MRDARWQACTQPQRSHQSNKEKNKKKGKKKNTLTRQQLQSIAKRAKQVVARAAGSSMILERLLNKIKTQKMQKQIPSYQMDDAQSELNDMKKLQDEFDEVTDENAKDLSAKSQDAIKACAKADGVADNLQAMMAIALSLNLPTRWWEITAINKL